MYDYVVWKLENYWFGLVKISVIWFFVKWVKVELFFDRDYIIKDYKLFLDNFKELLIKVIDMWVKCIYK